jgi:fatty-acyl-CoA synthase
MTIRTLSDIEAIEAHGFDAVYPQQSPWDILRTQAVQRPEAIAIRYLRDADDPSRDECVSYAQLADRIMGAARLFRAHGVTPKKAVAILTQHTVSAQIALWGGANRGAGLPDQSHAET